MTAKNHKTSSSNAMSSAESKKIWSMQESVYREITHLKDTHEHIWQTSTLHLIERIAL